MNPEDWTILTVERIFRRLRDGLKKTVLAWGVVGSLFLYVGCKDSGNNTGSGGGITLDNTDTSTVIQIGDGTLTTSSNEYHCEGEQLVTTPVTTVMNYEIVDGNLQTWEDGDCSKIIFTGTSATVQGTWTTDFTTTPTNDPNCSDEDGLEEMLPYLNNASGTAVVSDAMVVLTMEGNLCMAHLMANEILSNTEDFADEDSMFAVSQVQAQGCSRVSFMLGEGTLNVPGSATFAENANGDITATFSMGNCSSTATMPGFGSIPQCPEEDPFDNPEMQECLFKYIFENGCPADFLLSVLGTESGMTKVNCTTLQIVDPQSGLSMTMQMSYAPGGMNVAITIGPCSTTYFQAFDGSTGGDPFQDDPAFAQCVEDLGVNTLAKLSIPSLPLPSLTR